jgi:hypothetical protein
VDANPVLMHRIERVALFGSYLTRKSILGDLDVAVELSAIEGRDHAALFAAFPIPDHAHPLDRLHWPEVVAKCSLRVAPQVHALFWQVLASKELSCRLIFRA